MKGVILNAGQGKRLFPITKCVSKGLVPVYDRPALMYHMDFFADMGIRDIAIVVSVANEAAYRDFLREIDTRGINITLRIQKAGEGVLAAFTSCLDFVRGDDVVMVMGDGMYFIEDMSALKAQAELCFAEDKVGIVQGDAKPGYYAGFFDRQGDGLRYDYRTATEGERCAIGMHFIPRSLTTSIEGFIKPGYTETDAADVSMSLLRSDRLALPQIASRDVWFDIGTAEQLFQASAYAREKCRHSLCSD